MFRTFLSLALVTLLSASASAASVGFMGEFTAETLGNGTGFLGNGLPATPVMFSAFDDEFRFSEGGSIGFLQHKPNFDLGGANVWAISGTATVNDNGASDLVQFILNLSTTGFNGAVDGQFSMTFTGDLISNGSFVNQANFSELMNYPDGPFEDFTGDPISASTSIQYTDFSTSIIHSYAGTAFAVPEPSSLLFLAALGCVGVMRRRRS